MSEKRAKAKRKKEKDELKVKLMPKSLIPHDENFIRQISISKKEC